MGQRYARHLLLASVIQAHYSHLLLPCEPAAKQPSRGAKAQPPAHGNSVSAFGAPRQGLFSRIAHFIYSIVGRRFRQFSFIRRFTYFILLLFSYYFRFAFWLPRPQLLQASPHFPILSPAANYTPNTLRDIFADTALASIIILI